MSAIFRSQRLCSALRRCPGRMSIRLASSSTRWDESMFSDQSSYSHLKTSEVMRAWVVLKMCSFDYFVQNAIRILERSQQILGRRFLEKLLRPTLYRQFVAGDDPQSLMQTAERLKRIGIRLMVLPSVEEDIGQETGRNSRYDSNTQLTLELAEITAQHGGPLSCLQTKITALLSADLLLKIAGQNRDKDQLRRTVNLWANYMAGGSFTSLAYLDQTENRDLQRGLERLKIIGQTAADRQLRLLVDGEYTYLNAAIAIAALSMAGAFNGQRPIVWNTYQCYLREAFDKVNRELDITNDMGVCFGAKIVRGAYLERERQDARAGNYPDPTNETYESTSAMYNRVVERLIDEVSRRSHQCNMIVATHNEASILKAMDLMAQRRIQPSDNTVVFGQLYGMASNITTKLASEGYIVYNSVPYGNLFDVLPYLSRRAMENRAVFQGTRRERSLLTRELRSRIFGY